MVVFDNLNHAEKQKPMDIHGNRTNIQTGWLTKPKGSYPPLQPFYLISFHSPSSSLCTILLCSCHIHPESPFLCCFFCLEWYPWIPGIFSVLVTSHCSSLKLKKSWQSNLKQLLFMASQSSDSHYPILLSSMTPFNIGYYLICLVSCFFVFSSSLLNIIFMKTKDHIYLVHFCIPQIWDKRYSNSCCVNE